ncbi:hypothetical protein QNI23_008680 [Bermanella sp. WJH001]|uniref:hypothetical protein n=1 Tax=Bermanella sp. WJH001 TaxID=3048005 RepID=UPI0024BE6AB4|nr:hypothetical protein [Bermanella sp. WJH001]MDJ1537065.1 hypothetical protein [Bermanella sp. WJH001]
MKVILFAIVSFVLAGCQGLPQGSPDFYTWVDETGQIRTIKKEKKEKKEVTQSPANIATDTKAPPLNQFNESDYVSSDELDKKINNQKMFAWQEQSGRQVVREEAVINQESDLSISSNRINEVVLSAYREGEQLLFSDIDGVSLDLNRYYRFNQQTQHDYLLIELDQDYGQIKIKSFVQNNSVAMPQIIPLSDKFKQEYSFENPYQFREPESWYGYGYLHGDLNLPNNTQYILLIPSLSSGVIEAEDGIIIKQVNLGNLVLYSGN